MKTDVHLQYNITVVKQSDSGPNRQALVSTKIGGKNDIFSEPIGFLRIVNPYF